MRLVEPDAALSQAFIEWFNERLMAQLLHIRGLRYVVQYPAGIKCPAELFLHFRAGASVTLEMVREEDDSLLLIRVHLG